MSAPLPVVGLTNSPSRWNLTYGSNIYSFYDTNTTSPIFALQVVDTSGVVKLDLRQPANLAGYAHFDLQNVLQNYVGINQSIENTTSLTTSDVEAFRFKLKYGYENSTGGTTTQGTLPSTASTNDYVVLNGRKPFNELTWNSTPYQITMNSFLGCPVIAGKQLALTDWSYGVQDGANITDGKPTYVTTGTNVYTQKRRRSDHFTLSFMNQTISGTTAPLLINKKIGGFRISIYNGNTSLSDTFIQNTTSAGGGPGTIVSGTTDISHPFDVITIGCGAQNTLFNSYPTATHYYVSTWVATSGSCSATQTFYANAPSSQIYKIDIVDDECNDFDQVQVSWLNSFGFRDYFYFQKRVDKSVNIQRNTYQQPLGSWGDATFTINTYDQGEKVYSQDLKEVYSINTRYLSDNEAAFLKNLYISPDVRVRFNGETNWYSIVITDSSWVERTFRKNRLFQNTLNFTLSNKLYIQNG